MSASVGLVGVVLVSHSARLAGGLAEVIREVAGPDVAVVAAGGTDDDRLGTSDARVRRAAEGADRGAGVVLLADLGSAVLTARVVVEDPDDRVSRDGPTGRIALADAPFVEGAVAAAVTASTGAGLDAVVDAAVGAWQARKT